VAALEHAGINHTGYEGDWRLLPSTNEVKLGDYAELYNLIYFADTNLFKISETMLNDFRSKVTISDEPDTIHNYLSQYLTSLYNGDFTTISSAEGLLVIKETAELSNSSLEDNPNGYAYRYALENLNPFALVDNSHSSNLYYEHNKNGELNSDNFTTEYLQDRIDLLLYKNEAYMQNNSEYNGDGKNIENIVTPLENVIYEDLKIGFKAILNIGGSLPHKLVTFGKDTSDSLEDAINGASEGDRLYGRGGDDTIFGNGGDDYIEGGEGVDTIDGGEGVDIIWGGKDGDSLNGGADNDIIYGEEGIDTLNGGAGYDTLNGGAGNDTLYGNSLSNSQNDLIGNHFTGGLGFDSLRGTMGLDTYHFELGDSSIVGGYDTIYDLSEGNRLSFGQGIDPANFKYSMMAGTGDLGVFYSGDDFFVINDWVNNQDVFDNLTVELHGQGETYISTGLIVGTVQYGPHPDQYSNATFLHQSVSVIEGYELRSIIVSDTITPNLLGTITINESLSDLSFDFIELSGKFVAYTKGTSYTYDYYNDLGSDEYLTNSNFKGIIDAHLITGIGSFTSEDISFGEDLNYNPSYEVIRHFNYKFNDQTISFDDLLKIALNYEGTSGADIVSSLGNSNVSSGDYYTSSDEKIINTYDGVDSISVGGANFTVTAGKGDDLLYSDRTEGTNKYIFRPGDGNDTFYTPGNTVGISFEDAADGTAISLKDLSVELTGDYHVTLKYTQHDTIEFTSYTYSIPNHSFTLSDGSFHYFDEITRIENGTSEAETISLSATAGSIVNSGAGDDIINDNGYSDTVYTFNVGDGQDTIVESDGVDSITLGINITSQDIVFERDDSSDLIIRYSATDTITVSNWFEAIERQIESIVFNDGSRFDAFYIGDQADLLPTPAVTIVGTEVADSLIGGDDDNDLIGLAGDDLLDAGLYGYNTLDGGLDNDFLWGGYDTDGYLFAAGDGVDFINDLGGNDYIEFALGVEFSGVFFTREGDNLTVNYADFDSVSIESWYLGLDYQIEDIYFADGTVWDSTYLNEEADFLIGEVMLPDPLELIGTEFYDLLIGGAGNDILAGLTGDDELMGGLGGDYYLFSQGDGVDFIYEEGGADTIQFDMSITPEDILLTMSGDALIIDYGISDIIVVDGWGLTPDYQIESISFDNGVVWDQLTLTGMIQPEEL